MAESKETTYYKQRVLERDLKIDELGKLLENRNKQIKDLNEQIQRLKAEKFVNSTEEDIIKKILSYYAKGYQFSLILEKLRFNAYDVDVEKIRSICLNLDDLENTYILYYKEQVEAYEKSIKINPELLKDNLIQRYQLLINDVSEDLSKTESIDEKRKLRQEMNLHMDKLNNVLKVISSSNDILETSREVENIKNEIKSSVKIISFDKSKLTKA